tara:strand:- start:166 stop:546 length:381 start_codon:yes stop_codon:yes gene_type:complete
MSKQTITISMILEDLSNGIDRKGIQDKYDLKLWEVTTMFDHPQLKGKRPSKKKELSFDFIDDISVPSLSVSEEVVDPAQITLDEGIEEITATQDSTSEYANEEEEEVEDAPLYEELVEDDLDTFEL